MLPSELGSKNVVSMTVVKDFGVGAVTTVWVMYEGPPSYAEHSTTESIKFDVSEIVVTLQWLATVGFFRLG